MEHKGGPMYSIGKAMLFASAQVAFASIELDSKFSISEINTQQRLDDAASHLKSYVFIAIFWTVASVLTQYSVYGVEAGFYTLVANLILLLWILASYKSMFEKIVRDNHLKFPNIF
jgi:hypothetical protein